MIAALRQYYGVREMCRWSRVSPSGYYDWVGREPSARARENKALLEQIRVIHQESRQAYGVLRIQAELREAGVHVGHSRIARLMQVNGLRSRHRRRKRRAAKAHGLAIARNHLKRQFTVGTPNRVWVADMTYIETGEGWLYLAVLMDLYSRRIVGWKTGGRMTRQLVIDTLQRALVLRRPGRGLLHHSDQGSQYASIDYQMMLKRNGITCSMNRAGNCYDNAVIESFFGSLKKEWVRGKWYATRDEATRDLFDYIEVFYNRKRRHSALGLISPEAFEKRRDHA